MSVLHAAQRKTTLVVQRFTALSYQ